MMVSVEEARARMLRGAAPLEAETIALENADGRVLAAPVIAARDQPPFNVAAMDGYAFRAADTPGRLKIVGDSAAGRPYAQALAPGACVRISTGAPLPSEADAVLMQEDATIEDGALIVHKSAPRRHVRPRAGDFAAGEKLLPIGRRLSAGDITLAAAAGQAQLHVARAPRIALLCSGDELAAPGDACNESQIFDSASFGVAALIKAWGGAPMRNAPAPDRQDAIAHAAAKALDGADLLVLIGGASVGPHDHGRAALDALGFSLIVEKIAVKPGKPTWFARGPRGAVLGLPGNPASALVCARLFLAPLLEAMLGVNQPLASCFETARLAAPLNANGDRETYLRAVRASTAQGDVLTSDEDQDSSLVSVLSSSNALIQRMPKAPALAAGDWARFMRWTP